MIEQGEIEKGLADLDQAIELRADDVASLLTRAKVYAEQDKNDAALADLNHVLQLEPKNRRALIARTRIYKQNGELDLALHDINAILEASPNPTEMVQVLKLRAEIFFTQGNGEKALADISQARTIEPSNPELMIQHASMLEKLGQREAALKVCLLYTS